MPGSELVDVDGRGAVASDHRRRHAVPHEGAVPSLGPFHDDALTRCPGVSAVYGGEIHRYSVLRKRRHLLGDGVRALIAVDPTVGRNLLQVDAAEPFISSNLSSSTCNTLASVRVVPWRTTSAVQAKWFK